jgi:UDP-glucose 4-epimerase
VRPPAGGRTVLVTGVAGPLGMAVAAECMRRGVETRGVARSSGEAPSFESLEKMLGIDRVVVGDLNDEQFAAETCGRAGEIVHLAGSSGVAASFADPIGDLLGTACPLVNVLRSVAPGSRVVLVSSQLVYGVGGGRSRTETDPPAPESPYAAHQWLLETYGRVFARQRDLDVVVLRLGNVFGDLYRLDRPRAHGLVPRMLRDLVEKGEVGVYGDGQQTINLLHVADFARAAGATMSTPVVPGSYAVYNVSGDDLTVDEIAGLLVKGLGRGAVRMVPWPDGGVAMAQNLSLDDSAFRTTYGWQPEADVRERLTCLARQWECGDPWPNG